jgi:hypothetical protein
MSYIRISFVGLAMAVVTPSLEWMAFEAGVAHSSQLYHGNAYVLAQYITREEQQQRAQENLRQRQEERRQQQQDRSSSSVDRSTNTYGKEWLERELQGDKPRVNRTW